MAGKRGPSAMIRRSSSLRSVPSTSRLEQRKERVERLQGRDVGGGGDPAHLLQHGRDGVAHQRLEQRLLVAEVEIERALGDARALRHVVEPGRLEAVRGEHRQRRGQDRLAPRLGRNLAGAGRLVRGCFGGGLGRAGSRALDPSHLPRLSRLPRPAPRRAG